MYLPRIYDSSKWEYTRTHVKDFTPPNSKVISNLLLHKSYRKFKRAINFIHHIGIVESLQLHGLFDLKKKELDLLVKAKALVAIQLRASKKGKIYTAYVIHSCAKYTFNSLSQIVDNYWLNYSIETILQKLSAINFYIIFSRGKTDTKLKNDVTPFIAKINWRNIPFHICVLKGSTSVFSQHLKKLQATQNQTAQKIFLICEDIRHIQTLIPEIENANVQVRIIDEGLVLNELKNNDGTNEGTFDLSACMFYIKDGQMIKDKK